MSGANTSTVSAAAAGSGAPLETMGNLAAELPKVESTDVIMAASALKPDAMEQSFYEALVDKIPSGLINYMASENIHAQEDLSC